MQGSISGWRLCRSPYADLTGDGARLYGGRWNSPGRPVVYAAAEPSLALLEVRVHLDLPLELVPDDFVLVKLDLSGLKAEALDESPKDTRACGDAWLTELCSPLLRVPSIIIPESGNLLLNPAHPDAAKARIAAMRPFVFDPRLWSSP